MNRAPRHDNGLGRLGGSVERLGGLLGGFVIFGVFHGDFRPQVAALLACYRDRGKAGPTPEGVLVAFSVAAGATFHCPIISAARRNVKRALTLWRGAKRP